MSQEQPAGQAKRRRIFCIEQLGGNLSDVCTAFKNVPDIEAFWGSKYTNFESPFQIHSPALMQNLCCKNNGLFFALDGYLT